MDKLEIGDVTKYKGNTSKWLVIHELDSENIVEIYLDKDGFMITVGRNAFFLDLVLLRGVYDK